MKELEYVPDNDDILQTVSGEKPLVAAREHLTRGTRADDLATARYHIRAAQQALVILEDAPAE